MINTSTYYANAIATDTRKTAIWLTIDMDGTLETIGEDEIVGGSCSYDTSASNNGQFSFGTTYASRCKISLYKDYNIEDLIGKQFLITFGIARNATTYEYVDFGIMKITEALQEKNYITITGYDSLFGSDAFPDDAPNKTSGTLSLLLAYLMTYCNVTPYDLAAVNGKDVADYMPKRTPSDTLGYTYNIDIRNYNSPLEILSEIGTLCGGFFTNERRAYMPGLMGTDRLAFKPFPTIRDTAYTVIKNHIKRLKISSTTIKFGRIVVWVDGTKYVQNWGTGTAVYETELKILSGLSPTDIVSIVGAIAIRLTDMMSFTPCEFDYFGNPNIEIGDKIRIPYKDSYITTYVTDITYKQRGVQTIKCGGDVMLTDKTESTAEKQNRVTNQRISEKFNVAAQRSTTAVPLQVKILESSGYYTDIYESGEINLTTKNTFLINGYVTVNPTVAGQTLLIKIGKRAENSSIYTYSTYVARYHMPISGKQSINIAQNIDLDYTEGWNKIKVQAMVIGSSGTAQIEEMNFLQIGNNY